MAAPTITGPKHSFYAVLIPFLVDRGDEDHREIESIADGLLKRLKSNKARYVHKCVLQLGATNKDRDVRQLPLGNNDVLYVTAHGNLEVIGPMKGIDLTPKLLAEALDGHVAKTLGHLKIMTCRSGGNAFNEDAYYVSSLCRFLHAKGYVGLTVYGYTGNTGEMETKNPKHSYVVPGPHALDPKKVADPSLKTIEEKLLSEKQQDRRLRASQCRVAVSGAQGTVVQQPQNRWDFEDALTRRYNPDTGASV